MTQLVPIMRFIGHNSTLYSTDADEMMAIDQLVDFGHECLGGLLETAHAMLEPEENLAKAKPIFDNYFKIIEKRLASGCKYAAGTS